MEFPHLKDTQFPSIDNINVYKYQNVFDYARWNGKVTFKLLNVLWNDTYNDVPYFDTVEKRDNWFDTQTGYVGTLESMFNNTPENSIRIPVPYNDAYNYNYLVVEMPMQTSDNQPINYENKNIRVSRWFYFIEDMTQYAPSTTEVEIRLDYWITFIHTINIPYIMLERGHAPMMQTNVDTYLANPIENNEYLLAEDFNYGKDTVIASSDYVPIGNGKKYVLFCAPYSRADFANFGGSIYSGNSTLPTYADVSGRWGYQLQVNDYEWKYGNTDYNNARLPITNEIQTGVLNGCKCYAIDGDIASMFFAEMTNYYTHFIHGIQAMFILDENLFTRSDSFEFHGYRLYTVERKINNMNFELTKDMFDFDAKYANITKLYTFPYSELEVTDDNGNVFTAKIENTGNINMQTEVSLVYPFLNYNVFFTGINGDGTTTYKWQNISGSEITKNIWASDFEKFMMNWDVPIYSIFVSSEMEYASNNAADVSARRMGAITDYENATRYANNNYENTDDTMATNTANVNASTTTDVTNTNASTTTNVTNTAATGTTQNDNVLLENARDNLITGVTNDLNQLTETQQKAQMYADNARANKVIAESVTANVNNWAASAISSGIASALGAIGSGPAGLATGGIGYIGSQYSALATIGNNATMQNAIATFELNQLENVYIPMVENMQSNVRAANSDNTRHINQARTGETTNTVNTNNANAARNKATDDANAARSKATNDANAARTQNTETANADYTRDANIAAEQANLVQKQREAEARYKSARLQRPAEYSRYAGDFAPDALQRRGVRFNIRTQSKSAIAQTGDAMLRFGYALHRVWDMSKGYHYGKHFTFWKAEDIWINDGSGAANVATGVIADIFMRGVTIWRNPSEIGTIGIYNNI